MTAIVNKKTNGDTKQTLGQTKKINYIKKYPYWVYIVLGLGLAGLIVAITTTVLISNIYWAYSNYYFDTLNKIDNFTSILGKELGTNDFWKLLLINPEIFNSGFYIGGTAGQLATFTQFQDWCSQKGISPFLNEEQFQAFSYFFGVYNGSNVAPTLFDTSLAQQLWNPNGNAYYITTCVFWIASVITLSIILFNWWGYVVKQIKANQLPKAERIAAKKAKKEEKHLLKLRKKKIKKMRERNALKKVNNANNSINLNSFSKNSEIVNKQSNAIDSKSKLVTTNSNSKEE